MFKSIVDLDLRWTVPVLSFLSAMAGLFVTGELSFDHLMPHNCIPTALAISKVLVVAGPMLTGSHMLSATFSPRAADVAKTIMLIVGAAALVWMLTSPASAQTKPHVTGNPINDIKSDIDDLKGQSGPAGAVARAVGAKTDPTAAVGVCSQDIFGLLTPKNLVASLQACGEKLLADAQASLASAKADNDTTGVNCLGPAVPLIQAGIGTPASPGSPEVPANPGNPTATPPIPATPEIPAVPATIAEPPGFLLAFQKYREFVMAGGISACNAYVGTVLAAQVGSAAGLAGAAAGAVVLSPIK